MVATGYDASIPEEQQILDGSDLEARQLSRALGTDSIQGGHRA